jgi:hypothetical protein
MKKGLTMNMPSSKRTLTVAAALAVAVGAGGAVAASKSSPTSGDGFLARVASHLGISTEKLEAATTAAAIDQVDADLKAGRITQAQADELKARIRAGGAPLFFGGPHRFGGERGFGELHHHGGLAAAAKYLGLTVPQLLQKLSPSTSLADVAKAQGKSVDGLKEAMIADAKAHLDRAVKDGMITEAHAKEELSELKNRIDAIVNGELRGPGRHEEFRFRGGPRPDTSSLLPAA